MADPDVRVAVVEAPDELARMHGVLDAVWGGQGLLVGGSLLRALSFSGGYVAAAYRGQAIVGAGIGLVGLDEGHRPYLHSHMVAVLPEAQGAGVGLAIKLHQREWARRRGLSAITWTFDPLVARNAHFNLVKLGAVITAYHERFYGDMDDAINAGDESDRVLVRWPVEETGPPRAAVTVRPADPDAVVRLAEDAAGMPEIRAGRGPVELARVPRDVVALRTTRPEAARAWRHALRAVLAPDAGRPGIDVGFLASGWYVIRRPAGGEAPEG